MFLTGLGAFYLAFVADRLKRFWSLLSTCFKSDFFLVYAVNMDASKFLFRGDADLLILTNFLLIGKIVLCRYRYYILNIAIWSRPYLFWIFSSFSVLIRIFSFNLHFLDRKFPFLNNLAIGFSSRKIVF